LPACGCGRQFIEKFTLIEVYRSVHGGLTFAAEFQRQLDAMLAHLLGLTR
jgi:hypothetical protein